MKKLKKFLLLLIPFFTFNPAYSMNPENSSTLTFQDYLDLKQSILELNANLFRENLLENLSIEKIQSMTQAELKALINIIERNSESINKVNVQAEELLKKWKNEEDGSSIKEITRSWIKKIQDVKELSQDIKNVKETIEFQLLLNGLKIIEEILEEVTESNDIFTLKDNAKVRSLLDYFH